MSSFSIGISFATVMGTLLLAGGLSSLSAERNAADQRSVVKIIKSPAGYELHRDGEPYFIRGGGGWEFLDELKAAGGNSIRTWGGTMDSAAIDQAHELGLSVAYGLAMGQVRRGFNYSDPKQVKDQFEKLQGIVRQVKDHPALLIWGVGNEIELYTSGEDPAIWKAVEQISRMIKEEDPSHPTMTVVAGVTAAKVSAIKKYCPSLDLLGVNGYGTAASIPEQLTTFGWDKPYIVTEFGPTGPWNTVESPWGAPIEKSSSHKAHSYLVRYLAAVESEKSRCFGSYVYFWGVEPNFVKTHTWFETFLPGAGERLGIVDAMQLAWTGKLPSNLAPEILLLQTDAALKEVQPQSVHEAVVAALDRDGDPMEVRWEVREEMPTLVGKAPPVVEDCVVKAEGTRLSFRAPAQEGPYRLFVYVLDGQGNAATANTPFFVKKK